MAAITCDVAARVPSSRRAVAAAPFCNSSRRHLVITVVVLTAAAFIGGALNSLAGGGSLVTFPALLFAGLNPIVANASSVVALFPATFTSVWAYRRSMVEVK